MALIAGVGVDPEHSAEAARRASDIADRLGDTELRSWAWKARCDAAFSRGDYGEATAWTRRRFELVPRLTDPDHISLIYFFGLDPYVAAGRFDEACELARAHDEITSRLTPHHRMHGAWLLIEVERAVGRWEAVGDLTARAEEAVAANVATPCVGNAWSLLCCALAHAQLGNEPEAGRLEQAAEDLGMEGYGEWFDPLHVEIALARGELGDVERKLSEWQPRGFRDVIGLVARLNALVALGRRAEIEQDAPMLVKPETYLEPFALRALGLAREDDGLIERAISRFESMGLDWHAGETKRLVHGA